MARRRKTRPAEAPPKAPAAPAPRGRARFWRWARRIALLLVLLATAPPALILFYRWEAVKPWSTLMLLDAVTGREFTREWVELDDVAPVLVHSVIMSEDGQYCNHDGVDWAALNAVIDDAMEGEKTRGASTIAMQTAKNLFLWNGRSFVRKAMELPLALAGDRVWRKRRLMEIYLNIAEWGPGIYGIGAASRHHFNVPASKLNARQAALLAVTLPNPILRDPAKPGKGMQRLARLIERRAAKAGSYVMCVRKGA